MDKVYVGHAKAVPTQYGEILKISLTADDLKLLQENLENGWVNFSLFKRKAPSEKGMTHYGVIDNWKPNANQAPAQNTAPTEAPKATKKAAPKHTDEMDIEDLPF